MSTKLRNVLGAVMAAAMLASAAGARAGTISPAAERQHEQRSDQQDQGTDQKADNARPDNRHEAPPPQVRQAPHPAPSAPRASPPRDMQQRNDVAQHSEPLQHERDRSEASHGRYGPNHSLNEDLARLHGNEGNRNRGNDYRAGDRRSSPPRVIERLPANRHDYVWRGSHYYFSGGHWYQPYGSTYISVGIPFGLFVTTLPGYYTTFWYGGTRYFYADHNYFVYDPDDRGYVVTHSPYGDDDEAYNDAGSGQGDDLYIYPAKGQSEQQQADDRYECHKWAADQSNYDPLKDDYDADRNAAYRRAMIACLTGRGYTVN